MDFITGLPKVQGEDGILVVVDRLTKFAHFLAITTTQTAAQIADLFFREIFRLHGLPRRIVSNRDSKFMSLFWQELFRLSGAILTPITSYHPQTDGQTEIINKWMEGYLRHYVAGQQQTWVKWFRVGEYCYNTTHHMSIKMSPFRALYDYDPFDFTDLIFYEGRAPKANGSLQEYQDILRVLKENLEMAHNRQKKYYDQHRAERSYDMGDMVYLRLQPFRQSSLKKWRAEKLQPRFFDPYRILRNVGDVAYELELLEGSKIYNTFHVSLLKKVVGQHDISSTILPPLDDEGRLVLIPKKLLETKVNKLRSRQIQEHLIKWKDLPNKDYTWESSNILTHHALNCLRVSNLGRGGFVTSPLLFS